MHGLFGGVLSRGSVAKAVGDSAWLRAMLDFEAALARAGCGMGLVPEAAALRIQSACADLSKFDLDVLGSQAAAAGNPVAPLVQRLESLAGPGAGPYVHLGATSQDVLDTAMVLVARRAVTALLEDLLGTADTAADLAGRHRSTVMAGRTLGQHAVPTTFGLKAAGWATALDGAAVRLATVRDRLPVQFGGAAGTLSASDGQGIAVLEALAKDLGLAAPPLPWHTARLPVADLAGALGTAAGIVGKVALDLILLSQSEVAELTEGPPGRGGSTAMPHKRNPVAAISARASALRAPGLVATLLTAMHQEHERATGAWHAEWEPMSDLLRCTGSAVAWLRESLANLFVDVARMRTNMQAGAGAMASEAIAGAAAGRLGRAAAHERVRTALRRAVRDGVPVKEAVLSDAELATALAAVDLDALLAAGSRTGEAEALVDRALRLRAPRRQAEPT